MLRVGRPEPAAGQGGPQRAGGSDSRVTRGSSRALSLGPGKILVVRDRAAPWREQGQGKGKVCLEKIARRTSGVRAAEPPARPRRPPLL